MSSILKALKKLETEQTQQDRVCSLSETVHRQKANNGNRQSVSWIVKGSGVIVLSAMLGAGGVIGLGRVMKKDAKIAVGALSEESKSPVAISIKSDMPVKNSSALEKEAVKAVKPKEPAKKQAPPPAPPSPHVSSVSVSKKDDIKILQDSALKLMAIAWSAIPADRIAVINGHIIREGEAIGGVFVSRINENEVILQKGDELVKLIFRVQ